MSTAALGTAHWTNVHATRSPTSRHCSFVMITPYVLVSRKQARLMCLVLKFCDPPSGWYVMVK